jgi:hypothetical protein
MGHRLPKTMFDLTSARLKPATGLAPGVPLVSSAFLMREGRALVVALARRYVHTEDALERILRRRGMTEDEARAGVAAFVSGEITRPGTDGFFYSAATEFITAFARMTPASSFPAHEAAILLRLHPEPIQVEKRARAPARQPRPTVESVLAKLG